MCVYMYTKGAEKIPLIVGRGIHRLYSLQRGKIPPKKVVLDMTLNCI